ncbi:hypothetical protein ACFL0P_07790 [Candidatus Omnitrophota bacterium]
MGFKRKTFIIIKTAICCAAVFFVFYGVANAAISSSKSYKLHTAIVDNGGASVGSSSYSAGNTVGSALGNNAMTGTKYKVLGGALPTMNSIPDVTIASYNDGGLILDETPTLSWTYEDKDEDPQYYYQVQVSKDNFSTFVVDSELVLSDGKNFTTPILSTDEAGISYRWRVRVSDGFDYSGWQVANNGFRLTTAEMETPIIWAKEYSSSQEQIADGLWQDCADPYMYWEYPATGVDIVGYSYAWGSIPGDQIKTSGLSYQTPSDLLYDGIRTFNLKAKNTAGKWSELSSFALWIDRGGPVIGTYAPKNGTIISTDTPTISISVSDEMSGIDPNGIAMKINKSVAQVSYDEASKSIVYIPSVPLGEGNNVVSLEVSDIVGNKTATLVWSFEVDTRGPIGSIIVNNQDALTNSIYVNLSLSARDTTTGIESMSISNDGVFDTEEWEVFSTRKDSWVLPTITGTRKVYVKFKDAAGNESEIFTDTIELIIIAPGTVITSGPSLLTASTKALFTFKATIDNCVFKWKFDDGEWSEWSSKTSVSMKDLSKGNHYFKVQAARDVNNNGEIDPDEIDPVPEERTWTIGKKGALKPDILKKRPFRFWKEE